MEIDLGSMTLSCEAQSYFASWEELSIGASFTCDLHFQSYWGDPWIGVRRGTFEIPGIQTRDEIYFIRGTIIDMDGDENEMFVDCGAGFFFAMDTVDGLKAGDRIESEGSFVVYFPEDSNSQ